MKLFSNDTKKYLVKNSKYLFFLFSLGPKRASKIRKLFNLTKEDDVCQYVIKRPLPLKEVIIMN